MASTRGDSRHRVLGRAWVVLMLWTAISSFWIRHINEGAFSWLHVLSVVTLVTVTLGVVNARRGNVAAAPRQHGGQLARGRRGDGRGRGGPGADDPDVCRRRPGGALAFLVAVLLGTVVLVAAGSWLADVVDRRLPAPGVGGDGTAGIQP